MKYVAADGNGSVDPRFNTFSLEVDENGKVMTNVALSLEGVATPNGDATFAYWTIDGLGFDGGAYSYEANLSGKGFTGYVAGQTYTFTAYFNGPVVKPEQPDVYKIYVTVHNGTAHPSAAARLQAIFLPPRTRTSPSPSPRKRATLWIMPQSMATCC